MSCKLWQVDSWLNSGNEVKVYSIVSRCAKDGNYTSQKLFMTLEVLICFNEVLQILLGCYLATLVGFRIVCTVTATGCTSFAWNISRTLSLSQIWCLSDCWQTLVLRCLQAPQAVVIFLSFAPDGDSAVSGSLGCWAGYKGRDIMTPAHTTDFIDLDDRLQGIQRLGASCATTLDCFKIFHVIQPNIDRQNCCPPPDVWGKS